jgi:O-antigen/teichoic acid export membrane protein
MPQVNNKRIAKNTIILYFRTIITVFISLFTSRLILLLLGVDDYGINSAVAGVIAMFGVVSGSLSSSISRFITFELGHGDFIKLNKIFSTAINIQLIIGLLILILGETIGVWFLNTQMNIPDGRMVAANWVLQCALFSFFIGLTQIPYTACIIGHEKMTAFAWFSVVESVLRLVIVYMLYFSPIDKLIFYSILGLIVTTLIRVAQMIYCNMHFSECHYKFTFERALVKEMTGFAGWSFLTNTSWIFNTQGVSILINIFFGVAINAARGLAASIEGVVIKFCNDFMTAINPQITKSYAAGEINEMNNLICRGAKYSYYLLLVTSLPLVFEAHTVLKLWLGQVPDYTVTFFRLTFVFSLIQNLGSTGYTGCMATGNIKWYTIIITSVGFLVFPLTWFLFELGYPVETTYYVSIIIYSILVVIRLFIMRYLWGFPIFMFFSRVIYPIFVVTTLSLILPGVLYCYMEHGIIKTILVILTSITSGLIVIYSFGLNSNERKIFSDRAKIITNKYIKTKR